VDTSEALRKAREVELDLVLLAPNVEPPVAKIMDFAKFLYTERKKKAQSKAKAKKSELKEFRFGPTIGTGDLNTRIDRSKEFIQDGNRVKVTVLMKGREGMFPEVAFDRLKKFEEGLKEIAKPEAEPKRIGKMISVVFVAK
jgi:translation initiation factor IF-3